MEKKYKKVFEIIGRTNKGHFACSGWCTSIEIAKEIFLKKHPRFNGKAEIKTKMVEDMGNGMLISSYGGWEKLGEISSYKECKTA